jgi:hypothetical protein
MLSAAASSAFARAVFCSSTRVDDVRPDAVRLSEKPMVDPMKLRSGETTATKEPYPWV